MALSGPILPSGIREVAAGIFYAEPAASGFLLADRRIIEFLKTQAAQSPTRRARLCAHPDPLSDQHDMLIASHRDTYVAPHRHLQKSESFMVIEGETDILLFDEAGALTDLIRMGPASSSSPFFYRMPPRQFHALSIASSVLVFLESTKGPFDPGQSEYARWAPAPEREAEGRAYIAELCRHRASVTA
jgi:cupin fold WbuC family metalloprotein